MHSSPGQWPSAVRARTTSVGSALLVLTGFLVLLGTTPGAGTSGVAVVALGSVGSVALVTAACLARSAVLVQVLVTGLPSGSNQQQEWTATGRAIPRAQEPGRPGRPQPRAPGAALLPCPAR